MDFSARSGPLTCPPPGPPRLILPAGTSKLSKLTGNAAPVRRTSGQKDACRHLGLFPPDNFGPKRSFGATTGAMCSCCIRGQLCAQVGRSDTARTRLDITIGVNPCSARWSRTIYPAPLPFFRLPGQVQHNSRFRPTGVEAGKVATGPTTLGMPKAKCLKILFVLVPTTR
jgi:hypothetical protein